MKSGSWPFFSVLTLLLAGLVGKVSAAPEITSVTLGSAVGSGYYVAVANSNLTPISVDSGSTESSIFVMSGQTTGNVSSAAPDYSGGGGPIYSSASAPMEGLPSGYGTMLLQLKYDLASEAVATAADLNGLLSNLPTNTNTTIVGGSTGPVNKNNLSLNTAGIAAGTDVTIVVNMKGEVPNLVAVMGGSTPTVTYDAAGNAGQGELTLVSTTTGNGLSNASGDVFTSTFGFMILTDDVMGTGTTPLGIIAQTNHWVGDIFPLLPGFAGNAGTTGAAGTAAARCGTTIYGVTGETRNINLFMSDAAVTAVFGSAINDGTLSGFEGTLGQRETVTDTTNMGLAGKLISFDYTFASPKDVAFGIATSSTEIEPAPISSSNSSGGGFLSPWWLMLIGVPFLMRAGRRRS